MIKIAVLGSYSTQILVKELKSSLEDALIYESDYNQIDQEIINRKSELYKFDPQIIIIHETVISFKSVFYNYKGSKLNFYKNRIDRINGLILTINDFSQNIKIIYTSYDLDCNLLYGNFYPKIPESFDIQLNYFNYELIKFCSLKENFFLLDINKLALNNKNYRDERLLINFDIHFSISFIKVLAENLKNLINSFSGTFAKCIILDLDNTIWGGSIGENGQENIEIGEVGIGRAFSNLQKWLKSLKDRGIILCVCSKNDEMTAKKPFIKHPDMILKLEDIALFVANWKNKVDNINYIKSSLNIDYTSIVFLDDNPFERKLVKENLSELIVPELPKDPTKYLSFLTSQNLFEISNYSKFDKERTKIYQISQKRKKLETSMFNIENFLKSLKMKATIKTIDKDSISRVHQLIHRSNQFNARTKRYEKTEIISLSTNKKYITYVINLSDNIGENGIISIAILRYINQETLFLDTLVMSCRVFNRGIEFFLIDFLKNKFKNTKVKYLMLEWIPSKKNMLINQFYKALGYGKFKNTKEIKELEYIPISNFYIKLIDGDKIERKRNSSST